MSSSSAQRNPLDLLAEEFVARIRSGDRPTFAEYAQKYPELAEEIYDLFPALVEIEHLKPSTEDVTGEHIASINSIPAKVGEFRIVRQVGKGGMGVVYEAIQESLGRHVALKLLPPEAILDPLRLERFRREAKAAARLHHTNIVPVFGTGEADGRYYYAMQFISGHPLDAVIDEVRRLKDKSATLPTKAVTEVASSLLTGTFGGTHRSTRTTDIHSASQACSVTTTLSESGRHYWQTISSIGTQAAEALAYAHAQGIVHRDVKPANLLLDVEGTLWITDFGLAKSLDADDLTEAGDIVGTLRYMAPERLDGYGDHRADIYGLGLTLYELLCFRPAFQAENRAKLVEQVISANPINPRKINPNVPRDLETIVLKAMQADPAMRYQSAAELADDLRRYQEDRPIKARRTSSSEQAIRWCRRNPLVASLLAGILFLFAAGTAIASYFANDAWNEAKRANQAKLSEATALLEARRKVVRLALATGARYADGGNSDAALLWYQAALRDEPDVESNMEDHLLRLKLALNKKPLMIGLAVHDEPLVTADIDDAGTRVLALTKFGKANLWDIRAGQKVSELAHSGLVKSIAMSRDGLFALTGGTDGKVNIWNATDGRLLRTLVHGTVVVCLAWQPDSDIIVSVGGEAGVRLWNTLSGDSIATTLQAPGAYFLGFNADGTRAVTASEDGLARVWQMDTGQLLGQPIPHFTRDAYEILWNVRRGPVLSPDGKLVLTSTGRLRTGDDYQLACSEVESGKKQWQMQKFAYFQIFDAEGKNLLATQGGAALIDATGGKRLTLLSTPRECQSAVFLGDDRIASVSTGGLLQVWTQDSKAFTPTDQTLQMADSVRNLKALPDKRHLFVASADGTARLIDTAPRWTGKPLIESGRADMYRYPVRGDRFRKYSPDGTIECEYGAGENMRIGPSGTELLPIVLPVKSVSANFSRDGETVISTTTDAIQSWQASTGKPLSPPLAVALGEGDETAFSSDGKRVCLTSQAKREVRVFDLLTSQLLLEFSYPATEETTRAGSTLSDDGKWLATGDFAFAGAVEVWSVESNKRVARFMPHRGNLIKLDFSDDATRVLVSSSDTTARLWDVQSGEPIGPVLRHSRFVRHGEIAADGRRIVTRDSRGIVYLWDGIRGDLLGQWNSKSSSTTVNEAWFSADGKSLYCPEGAISLEDSSTPTGTLTQLIELMTGQRIDPLNECIEYLPANNFINAPRTYLEAFQQSIQNVSALSDPAALVEKSNSLRAKILNNQAWGLVSRPTSEQDTIRGLLLAEESATLLPNESTYSNTLGVALYRNHRIDEAIAQLERSLARHHADAYDLYFLAMCHAQRLDKTKAQNCFDRAVKWAEMPPRELTTTEMYELRRFRVEARELLDSVDKQTEGPN